MHQINVAKKVVESHNIQNIDALLQRKALQVYCFDNDVAIADPVGSYIVLDFGKESRGGVRLLTAEIESPTHTAQVRFRFGESLMEVYSDIGYKGATNHHAPRDFTMVVSALSDITFGDTGYRFVRIDFLEGAKVKIKSIYGTNEILRLPVKHGYQGKDARIKKIFETAKRTVDLCASSGLIWDGIKRDRLVWSGDLYPEIIALTSMYGRTKVVEDSLDFEATRPHLDDKWLVSLETYNMWWIICACEYYFQTQANDFIEKHLDFIVSNIELFDTYVKEDGEMLYEKPFVDWPTRYQVDEKTGARCINIIACQYAKRVLKEFGRDTTLVEKLLAKLQKGDMSVVDKKQVIGLKYFATGELSDEEYQKLIEGGAQGFSTFMSYFILKAIASRDKDLAISLMKEYYGAMLDKGATSFWEDFDMSWVEGSCRIDKKPKKKEKDIHGDFGKFCYTGYRHSLCHGWSAGVIKFIEEYCE